MSTRLGTSGWSFATRLLALALVPSLLMLVLVNVSLYVLSMKEAQADIRDRGRVVAAALAEGSRYGVISGNLPSVRRAVDGLMVADRSLAAVEVLDAERRPLLAVERALPADGVFTEEAVIQSGALDVDLLDRPTASTGGSASADRRVAGYVRVTMSPMPLLVAKRARLIQGSLLVLLACVGATAVGLVLARRLRSPLHRVMAALRQVRQGHFDVCIEPFADGELGELQRAIVEMASSLGSAHQHLAQEVEARTAELRAALEALEAADAERRRLIARGNELVEEERRRLSLEIHDELNASLVSVRLQTEVLAGYAADSGVADVVRTADVIRRLTDDLYRKARAIVTQLRPEVLDTLGLRGAVAELVRRFDESSPSCRFRLDAPSLPPLSDAVAIAVYRAVQEALSNVAKHALASACRVAMKVDAAEQGERLRVTVRDDGRGYDVEAGRSAGVGLIGIRERISAIRGDVTVTSARGEGTQVSIDVPLGKEEGRAR